MYAYNKYDYLIFLVQFMIYTTHDIWKLCQIVA